jgi:hypothetical protein
MSQKGNGGGFFTPGQGLGFWILDLVLLTIFTYLVYNFGYYSGNKDGNIEALTNNPSYELVTNPDSTKTWELIIKK